MKTVPKQLQLLMSRYTELVRVQLPAPGGIQFQALARKLESPREQALDVVREARDLPDWQRRPGLCSRREAGSCRRHRRLR